MGMHWRTYEGLVLEHDGAGMAQFASRSEWLDKLERRLS